MRPQRRITKAAALAALLLTDAPNAGRAQPRQPAVADAESREGRSACAGVEFSAEFAHGAPAPTPMRWAIRKLERRASLSPDVIEDGRNPFRSYARFYTARLYHGRTWYCGAFAELRADGLRPGVYLRGWGEALDGRCHAGRLGFDATAGRLAFFECSGL